MPKAPRHVSTGSNPFVFLHIGDLHLQAPRGRTAEDLSLILDQIARTAPPDVFDFVYLPGDLAENGCASEYALLSDALAKHSSLPIRLIPGDHDRQLGRMDDFEDFHAGLRGARGLRRPKFRKLDQPPDDCPPPGKLAKWPKLRIRQYYFRENFQGVRCLFLDIVSPGYGRKGIGLDFRLGKPQTLWLDKQLRRARDAGEDVAVFMHAYPDDLREPNDRLDIGGLFWERGVRIVEMGHTHYNELACDGRTLYAAARSVGQNEDGSVGYAVAAIDGPVTSWRFRALDHQPPFVLITSPADRRVARQPGTQAATGMTLDAAGRVLVRAVVLSDVAPRYVRCRVGTGAWMKMVPPGAGNRCYEARLPWPNDGRKIQVEAVHPDWNGHDPVGVDTDVIEPVTAYAPLGEPPGPIPEKPGSDTFRITTPWPEKGLRGDQLGPNKNGRKW